MADTIQFDLVSPERRVASYEVTSVVFPGADGDLTVMAHHAPLITSLRPGVLKTEGPNGVEEYVVKGGFAEISAAGVSVLAEESLPRSEMTQEALDRMVEEATRQHRRAQDHPDDATAVDDARKLLADMVAMGTHVGLDPKEPNL